jgi:hypothetical protein
MYMAHEIDVFDENNYVGLPIYSSRRIGGFFKYNPPLNVRVLNEITVAFWMNVLSVRALQSSFSSLTVTPFAISDGGSGDVFAITLQISSLITSTVKVIYNFKSTPSDPEDYYEEHQSPLFPTLLVKKWVYICVRINFFTGDSIL